MCALAVFPLYRILVFERIKVKLEKAVSQVRAWNILCCWNGLSGTEVC